MQVGRGRQLGTVRLVTALALTGSLAAAGCGEGLAGEHPLTLVPITAAAEDPRMQALVTLPAADDPAAAATLAVALRAEAPSPAPTAGPARPRALQALPTTWDAATLTLTHPTALAAARTATLTKGVDLTDNGSGGYAAATTFGGVLRPASGYTLAVELWDGGATGVVVARKTVTVNLAAGPNAVSVTLSLVGEKEGSPFAATETASTQLEPTIAAGPTDALALWVDDRAVVKEDVIGRRAAYDGTTPGSDATLTGALDLAQATPHLALDPGRSRFLAVWQSGDLLPDILGTLAGADGTPTGSPITVAAAALSDMRAPRVAYTADADQYAVVWADNRALNWDVYGQRVGGDGTLAGGNVVVADGAGDQTEPDVACADVSDRVLAVWRDGASQKVRGWFWNGGGGAFDISADAASANVQPAVASDPVTGDFLVAWVHQASPHAIRVRRVAADGSLGTETTIDTSGGAKASPRACYVPWLARFLVAWQVDADATAGVDHDVRGRFVTVAGAGAGATFDVASGAGNQTRPEAAALAGSQRVIVSYADETGGAQRVKLQRLY